MTTVRGLEVELTVLEDGILGNLGYREYTVQVGGYVLNPVPEVVQKDAGAYGQTAMNMFIDRLGGEGNPIGFYELQISRAIPEEVIRALEYWTISRDGYVAECLPVALVVTDSRYKVTLAVIKIAENGITPPPHTAYPTFDSTGFQFDNQPPLGAV